MLDEPTLQQLRAGMRGRVIAPTDPDYDTARRVHNGMIDKHPAVIARCAGVADVQTALHFGREHKLSIAVRGGGHNVAGKAVVDDGIVIDLSGMKGIRIDPRKQTALAQAGLTWGEFDAETQAYGLATTGGAVSTTGIAGLTLGGGIGYLQRKYGLSCDNLLSADVVTADSRILTASEDQNPDLFWGLRGGGGNFGIVTSFEYQVHPVGEMLAGPVFYPINDAKGVFGFFQEYATIAPDEVGAMFGVTTLPGGERAATIFFTHCGSRAEAEKAVAPLLEFGDPIESLIEPMGYRQLQQAFDDDFPFGVRNYWKSSNVAGLSDVAMDTVLSFVKAAPSPNPMVFVERLGGAISRVPSDATAFGHRDADFDLVIAAIWTDDAEEEAHINWARDFWQAMQPHSIDSVYVNYLSDEGPDRVRAAYGEHHFARLVDLKGKYDPENVFRNNQNISPATQASSGH
jgi:FAD/FMN-containing dehydrogenase